MEIVYRTRFILAFVLLAPMAQAQVFYRPDVARCMDRYTPSLGILTQNEAADICENYTNENLDCAVRVLTEFGTDEYMPAIRFCILKYSNRSLQICMRDEMRYSLNNNESVSIAEARRNCEQGQRRVGKRNPPPAPVLPRVEDPRPVKKYVPRDVVEPEFQKTLENEYDFKISRERIKIELVRWLNAGPSEVSKIEITNYFNIVNQWLENIAILMTRSVSLKSVSFLLNGVEVNCIGTDFAPKEGLGERQYFTIHGCAIDRNQDDFRNRVKSFNYKFVDSIPETFRETMAEARKSWSGSGNINFNPDESDFLVIKY